MFLSINKKQSIDFKSLYQKWKQDYDRGNIKRARETAYIILDYLEKKGNAYKLSCYIEELEQIGFLPDEIKLFKKRELSIQGKKPSENILHRLREDAEKYLKDSYNEDLGLKFLRNLSILLMRFRIDTGLLNLTLKYAKIAKSRIIAQSIIDNLNVDKSLIKRLNRPLVENIKKEITTYMPYEDNIKIDNNEDAALYHSNSNKIIKKLMMKLSKYGNTQLDQNTDTFEEKKLKKKLLKNIDLSNDKEISDIVIMCLMIHFFNCAMFFSKYIQCNILRHYLQGTITFEEGKYTECIHFIDNFFRNNPLSGKNRCSLVYLQAKSYEKLGNARESSLRYNFLKDQKLYLDFSN